MASFGNTALSNFFMFSDQSSHTTKTYTSLLHTVSKNLATVLDPSIQLFYEFRLHFYFSTTRPSLHLWSEFFHDICIEKISIRLAIFSSRKYNQRPDTSVTAQCDLFSWKSNDVRSGQIKYGRRSGVHDTIRLYIIY